jgi:hypothetical protein
VNDPGTVVHWRTAEHLNREHIWLVADDQDGGMVSVCITATVNGEDELELPSQMPRKCSRCLLLFAGHRMHARDGS